MRDEKIQTRNHKLCGSTKHSTDVLNKRASTTSGQKDPNGQMGLIAACSNMRGPPPQARSLTPQTRYGCNADENMHVYDKMFAKCTVGNHAFCTYAIH